MSREGGIVFIGRSRPRVLNVERIRDFEFGEETKSTEK